MLLLACDRRLALLLYLNDFRLTLCIVRDHYAAIHEESKLLLYALEKQSTVVRRIYLLRLVRLVTQICDVAMLLSVGAMHRVEALGMECG